MTDSSWWAIITGTTLGLGLWSLASLIPKLAQPRFARRIAPYLQDVSQGARDMLQPPSPGPAPALALLVRPVFDPLRRALGALLGNVEVIERRLRQAGSGTTIEAYRGQQALAVIVGLAAGSLGAAVAGAAGPAAQVVLVATGAIAGVLTRDALLQRAAKRRLARLTEELPVVLEFLALSLSAGEGILDALRRVARAGSGELAAEFSGVLATAATGIPLSEALTRLAHDLDLPPLTRCAEQVIAALDRGTPLGEVLRAQAQDARDDARRQLLESAGRKEIAMLFPLVFGVLPVTIAFAVFPGIFVLQIGL
ncbi:tight adherence protein C [Leifsonia sp. AK011]|uniref:type II secretion system F family protein n=1 Tax=Leifsonia sp. AK011 TaxID=2723075 RepID=UPI0015C87606|nr:type II secretion system F family protein [Leifsonia sp. AK011]NYF10249.1 tight adherence protein C [Leifsonia sp. AK011]